MVQLQSIFGIPVVWRDKKLMLELNSEATLSELGKELQHLTNVKPDTMKVIVPLSSTKSSKLFLPFSDEHSCLKLEDLGIMQGKPLRMMGVSENEVDQLLKDAKSNLRIAGFEDEEKRLKQRISRKPQISLKLPEGPYIFCDFRALELPGVQLNPPPSEALRRMHMLAADPGIVAIMRKHRWRVGIMTEMAPEGYVGISPVCLLGLNKNHGEEISLRLRTDDLKGFRKYESIKKTLLHELAHMVYSEHDSNFIALDRQLNREAFALDWTRSRSHTLTDTQLLGPDDMDEDFESENNLPHKLGGESSHMAASACAASVAAAYNRWTDSSAIHQERPTAKEQDSDNLTIEAHAVLKSLGAVEELVTQNHHDDPSSNQNMLEPDPDDEVKEIMNLEPCSECIEGMNQVVADCGDTEMTEGVSSYPVNGTLDSANLHVEPDPDDSPSVRIENDAKGMRVGDQPDRDDIGASDSSGTDANNDSGGDLQLNDVTQMSNPYEVQENRTGQPLPKVDFLTSNQLQILGDTTEELDLDDEQLRRIRDPVTAFCNRLTKAIEILQNNLGPTEANGVLQTLFRIIRNIIEYPNELKYKRLRKANPAFQRAVAYSKAAVGVLSVIGFVEESIVDEVGKSETYVVLKRNDPALLWLAKSTIEMHVR